MMAKYEGIADSEFSMAHKGIIVHTLKDNKRILKNGEFIDGINRLQEFLVKNNIKNKREDVKDIFTDALLPK